MDSSSSEEDKSTDLQTSSYSDSFHSESSVLSAKCKTKNEDKQDSKIAKAIRWPSNEHFNIALGFTKIEELISTWNRKDYWQHCIDFISQVKAISSDYYFYEVKWSIPTNKSPIPALTASIFFKIEVNHLKPLERDVQVTYQFETSRFIHTAGRIKFQEKWLEEILLYKLTIFPYINF